MKAVILAGGMGTRISEESHLRPKPMIEIGGRPILWHIMKICAVHGIHDFVVCLGYRGYMVKEYFANYVTHNTDLTVDLAKGSIAYHSATRDPWRVTLVDTGEQTQTGGRLKRIAPWVAGESSFLMTYGDGVADIDIGRLAAQHDAAGRLATVTAVVPPGRFGALDLDGELVRSFTEKPPGDGGLINGGFFMLSPRALDYVDGDATVWEREPMQRLAADGQLGAYRHPGWWAAMDTLRDRTRLEELWREGAGALETLVNAERRAYWRGRRVLLTGHTGFKGAWAALWLEALGAEVTGLALAPQTPQYDAFGPWPGLRSLQVDLRERDALRGALAGQRFDLALHFAAQSLVRRSVREPVATFAANVMGTLHLLDALSDAPPAVVLVATSDKVYRNDDGGPHVEADPFGGDDPYSASKAAAELAVHAWRGAIWAGRDVRLATARAGNVIGGGDFAEDRLIPDAVRALMAGQRLSLRHPGATRPWQHVLDVLDGYFRYVERLAAGDALPPALNFGPSGAACLPVADVIARLSRALGRDIAALEASPAQSIEKQRLELDAGAAQRLLGWTPRLPIDEALRWTAEGYRPWLAGGDARAIALAQIARYEALA